MLPERVSAPRSKAILSLGTRNGRSTSLKAGLFSSLTQSLALVKTPSAPRAAERIDVISEAP